MALRNQVDQALVTTRGAVVSDVLQTNSVTGSKSTSRDGSGDAHSSAIEILRGVVRTSVSVR